MASDRCTVFMERDLHHYLSEGYSVEETLTAVLHSVCENYLTKVAVEGMIGRTVLFQGATAKNKALVAAFEQRLNQPVHVSRYCHLTGALGAALMLAEQGQARTCFRGIEFWHKTIPLQREICDLCTNHCKLTVATIDGQRVAYGFTCGRDYETKRYVHRNPSGFDLIRERRKAFTLSAPVIKKGTRPVIGIPAALYLYEDLEFWHFFFNRLGFEVTDSRNFDQGITAGRRSAGAQFCAPIAALHGHVQYLQDHCDALFLPYYLETKSGDRNVRRQYCYYTQFSVPMASTMVGGKRCRRLLSPLVHYLYNSIHTKIQLYKTLKSFVPQVITFKAVATAYDQAREFKQQALAALHTRFEQVRPTGQEIYAVLLGRPYTILSPAMNKGIPDIFGNLGIKTFFQEMLGDHSDSMPSSTPLLKELHWHHAAAVLARAEQIGHMPGAYPVLITSFKCSPDAFVIDYFQQTMASLGKPYLVLQVDDHDARGGYETRIEAAVRAFRNHFRHTGQQDTATARKTGVSPVPAKRRFPAGKTLLLPNWDDLTIPLIATALQREGIDARILEHHPDIVQKSLRFNTGQCIPVNIIAQECIDYIATHDLNPGQTLLWMPAANIACNIHLYPAYIHQALQAGGNGRGRAGVHVGPMSMSDLSLKMPLRAYFAYMFGGYLRRLGCRIRPYEEIPGRTDQAMTRSMVLLHSVFAGQADYEPTLARIVSLFKEIPVSPERRPKVAIIRRSVCPGQCRHQPGLDPFHRSQWRGGAHHSLFRLFEDDCQILPAQMDDRGTLSGSAQFKTHPDHPQDTRKHLLALFRTNPPGIRTGLQ